MLLLIYLSIKMYSIEKYFVPIGESNSIKGGKRLEKLDVSEVQEKLREVQAWGLTGEKWIERKYRFLDYLNGIEFVQSVANLSESVNHHPSISIDYKVVTVKISSWRAKGLTALDFELAKKYDELYIKIKMS